MFNKWNVQCYWSGVHVCVTFVVVANQTVKTHESRSHPVSRHSPQSSLWTHWTVFTLPVCPFRTATTPLSWHKTITNRMFTEAIHKKEDVYIQLWDARVTLAVTINKKLNLQRDLDRLYYLWVVQSYRGTCSKGNNPATTPRNNIWSPVCATCYMACFKYGRRHLENCICGVTLN